MFRIPKEISDAIAFKIQHFTNLEFALLLIILVIFGIYLYTTFLSKKESEKSKYTKHLLTLRNEIEKLKIKVDYIDESINDILDQLLSSNDYQKEKIPKLLVKFSELKTELVSISKDIETVKKNLEDINNNVRNISSLRNINFG